VSRNLVIAMVFAAVALLGFWGLWRWFAVEPPLTRAGFLEARPATAAPRQDVPIRSIRALNKPLVAKKLDLPAAVADDPSQLVLAAVTVPASKGGATAVAILDTATGETRTLVREKPRPLLGFEKGGAAGIRYGVSNDGPTAVLFVRQDVARVGNVYLSGYAEAGRDARAMVELSYRW
jgi:hypothetical protein